MEKLPLKAEFSLYTPLESFMRVIRRNEPDVEVDKMLDFDAKSGAQSTFYGLLMPSRRY